MKLFQAHPGVLALAAALSLGGCSVLDSNKIDYRSASKAKTSSLEVPPDLDQLSRETRYAIPGGPVTASSFEGTRATSAPSVPVAANIVGDARIERAGQDRWLVVNRSPEQLWPAVREFWQENGFVLTTEQPTLGLLETDWAENRAKIPQDFIRNTLGKVLDSFYSTSERDRFRTRLERGANGGTEIYITHRGLVEVYATQNRDSTVWQPRPADPALEDEFLRRLMVKLGTPAEKAQNLVASAPTQPASRVTTLDGAPVVQLDDGFDRAWRRVGLALDRTGFTVEDRDRANGTYFVRYVEPTDKKKEGGFFSKLFGRDEKASMPARYRIAVKSQGTSTIVSVLNANGASEASATAQRIVQAIAEDLK